jgi:hypothetical protein
MGRLGDGEAKTNNAMEGGKQQDTSQFIRKEWHD